MLEHIQFLRDYVKSYFTGLVFDEEKHKYTYNDKEMKAVSYVIKDFTEPFKERESAERVALKRGVCVDDILKEWEEIRVNACNEGTNAHLFGEQYAFDKTLKPKTGLDLAIKKFWDSMPDYMIPFIMELQMFHKKIDIAGTADILMYDKKNEVFHLLDYKTNIDLFKNFKDKRLLYPFNDLQDNPFNKYTIQLNIYQLMFEQCGLKIDKRIIIHITREGQYKTYRVPDIREKLKHVLKID